MLFGRDGDRDTEAFTVGQLRRVLGGLQRFSLAAGAKTAAQDINLLSDMLGPYSERNLAKFCAEMKAKLRVAAEKPKSGKKPASSKSRAATNDAAIRGYLDDLRAAGIDRASFDAVFQRLASDQSLKAADMGEIARQFANSVTKYKSMAAAQADISKAFVRNARFENKLR